MREAEQTAVQFAGAVERTAVEVDELVKRYPGSLVNAVDNVSFRVARREVFGLLGPNGAGKTTTVAVLTTRARPTSGKAVVAGVDVVAQPVAARARLAVVPQRSNLDRSLSIRDNLIFHAAYHGVAASDRSKRADALLAEFGLADRAKDRPDFFSGGQSQRVMIARALMHSPEVLFLDEPTTGLDPAARLFVWERIRAMSRAGVTIILTTHSMEEASALCDRVGIMDRGHLLALDSPTNLVRSLPGSATVELAIQPPDASSLESFTTRLRSLEGVEAVEVLRGEFGSPIRIRLSVRGEATALVAPAASLASEAGLGVKDVRLGTATLEDVFIHLTGRTLR